MYVCMYIYIHIYIYIYIYNYYNICLHNKKSVLLIVGLNLIVLLIVPRLVLRRKLYLKYSSESFLYPVANKFIQRDNEA